MHSIKFIYLVRFIRTMMDQHFVAVPFKSHLQFCLGRDSFHIFKNLFSALVMFQYLRLSYFVNEAGQVSHLFYFSVFNNAFGYDGLF